MIFGSKFFLEGGVVVGRSLGVLEIPRSLPLSFSTLDPDRRLLFTGQGAAEAAPVAPAEKNPQAIQEHVISHAGPHHLQQAFPCMARVSDVAP
jgi:hypothetical protein